jgi:hypothetical protein
LTAQRAYIPLRPLASNSWESLQRFPDLEPQELTVVSDTGEVWLGNHAWIICLWALRDYRGWAERLSTPALLPFARQAFAILSESRFALSRMLGLRSDAELTEQFESVYIPPCQIQR